MFEVNYSRYGNLNSALFDTLQHAKNFAKYSNDNGEAYILDIIDKSKNIKYDFDEIVEE